MKKINLLFILLVLVISGIGIAQGQTIQDNIGASGFVSNNYFFGGGVQTYPAGNFQQFKAVNIELISGAKTLIHFDFDAEHHATFDGGAANYGQTPLNVTDTVTGQLIAQGTIGYQRLFDNAFPFPNELAGYQYMSFNFWNNTGLSGTRLLTLSYNTSAMGNMLYNFPANNETAFNAPSGYIKSSCYNGGSDYGTNSGFWTLNKDSEFRNSYSVTKPAGLGIEGYVFKHEIDGSIIYNSRAYIVNATDHTGLTSEAEINSGFFYFNVIASNIIIAIKDPDNNWWNTSALFPENQSTVIPGIFNVTFQVRNREGSLIPDAHVSFAPSTGPVLTGRTNSSGMITFNAVPGSAAAIVDVTTISYPEYIETFTVNQDLIKQITLAPVTVRLNLDVKDSSLGFYLDGVDIGIKNTTSGIWRNSTGHSGAIFFDSTGTNYEYPLSINQNVILAASKAGYFPQSKNVTITSDGQLITIGLVQINGTAPSSGNFTAIIGSTDSQTGNPISGASITVQELGRIGLTNSAGVATFRNLPVGSYQLQVQAPNYQSALSDISGTDQDTVMKNIRLDRNGCTRSDQNVLTCNGTAIGGGGVVNGTVQNPNERAAAGVSYFLDNIFNFAAVVLILIGLWFVKKIFFS
jgi:hypothetical protein